MLSAAFVCLFVCLCVCQHDNFPVSKHRMMKLALYKSLGRVRMWDHSPLGAQPPKNVALGYDVWKINAGCLHVVLTHAFSGVTTL